MVSPTWSTVDLWCQRILKGAAAPMPIVTSAACCSSRFFGLVSLTRPRPRWYCWERVIHFHWNRPADLTNVPELVEKVRSHGGTLVEYAWVWSALLFTYRRTHIVWLRPGGSRVARGLGYTLFSALLGWWSLMGIFWTIQALVQNLRGGVDVTASLSDPTGAPFSHDSAREERSSRRGMALAYAGVLFILLALAIVTCVLPYIKELRRVL